jgi:hypothetical protein
MARLIENYQDLQDTVRDWLNKRNLDQQIPVFIYLAERKIFRWYRNQNNEKLVRYDMRINPDTQQGSTEILLSDQIDLPSDYLESLTLQVHPWNETTGTLPDVDGKPLQRVSQQELLARRYARNREGLPYTGEPEIFARIRDAIVMHPAPETASLVTFQYYCDLSGLLDTPTSDNNVLARAPDLYLYASLLEAEPYLKPEDTAMQRIPIWKTMYEEAKQAIIEQNDAELFSGSVTEIQSAWGGGGAMYPGRDSTRTGWA